MVVKNMAASVLARLKLHARTEGMTFQMALQLFAQEEFLRRLSFSKYVENLILKGGMFIYILTEFDSRPTRDIDFMIRHMHGDLNNMEAVMKEICNIDTGNEFITLEVLGISQIGIEKEYPGVCISYMGRIQNVRIPFSIDVGIDDVIIPQPMKRKVVTRLPDFESPDVFTYSLESTIAEKFDAILKRMAGTSRMKDFYDIYYLSEMFDFNGVVLTNAIKATLEHRKRILERDTFDDMENFVNDQFLNTQWLAFEPAKDAEIEFVIVVNRLVVFLNPVYTAIIEQKRFNLTWNRNVGRWQ
jgi:predicted nucleotidyltransferase component of viral defense system